MVAVIIIAILMIFVFSLLLITYTLYASQSKKTASFRNAEAANTVSQAFKTELEDSQAEENSAFWKYLRCNIGQSETWPWYEPGTVGHEKEDAFRKFDLDYVHSYAALSGNGGELDGFPAKVQMTVYWMLPEGKDSSMVSPDIESFELTGIRLHMEIVCETAGPSLYQSTASP